ncbi:MAG: hypothetical protein JNM24_00975 [Bdellovibrionaceae bacterium]|nr:hypothetical protein [Pseudobdellovibrionaceae bacterium]
MELEILIVDDNRTDAETVALMLGELANVKVSIQTDAEKALHYFARYPKRFALILCDFNLNKKDLIYLRFISNISS